MIKLSKLHFVKQSRLLYTSVAIDTSARVGVMFIICTFYALCTNDAEEQFTLIFYGFFAVWFVLLLLGRPKFVVARLMTE